MNHVKRTALLIITALASISYGFSGGDGSPENPYQIAEPNQLIYMSQNPGYWDKHIILTADINMAEISGVQFNAIGSETYPFSGVFEGDYHHIHNFNYENYTGIETFGLFGWIEGANAEVRNLSLIDANINVPNSGSWQGGIGILIGRLEQGEISQCHVRNSVIQGREALGGLVGYNHGTIVNCSSRAEVIGGNDEAVGGLAGLNDGQISNCYSCGSVSGVLCVGGLVGYAFKNSSISNCYSQADTIVDYNYAAGLVVNNGGAIYKCYATGKVEGSTGGGLVFRNDGIVLGCFWDVETTGQDSSNGGIGLPTEFMQDPNTFTTAGWDFVGDDQGSEDNWQMCIDGVDYPRLAWQFIRPGDFIFPGRVDNYDLFVLANDWLSESSRCCDIAPPASPDGIVNLLDWSEFSRHWLTE